jgi:Tol biopolymer transport system component
VRTAAIVVLTLLVGSAAQAGQGSRSHTSFKLFKIRIDGKGRRSLLRNPDVNNYIHDISRDGKRILFVRGNTDSRPWDLYVADIDGRHLKVIASKNLLSVPVFSPDGRQVAFEAAYSCVDTGACYDRDVWIVNANGTGLRRFAPEAIAPSWSRDSRRLAYFGRFILEGQGAATVANVRGRSWTRELVPRERVQSGISKLVWSPRGDRLAYTVERPFGHPVRVVRLNARSGQNVHAFTGAAPSWSPDGGRLALTSSRPPTSVYVMGADGHHRRWLSAGSGPTWSPDGRWIAFGQDSRCGQLYIIRPNRSGRRQVTHEPCGAGFDVHWSPDSKHLIYLRIS